MRAVVLLCVGAMLGCGSNLDSYDNVHDLRVIGMMASPAELVYDTPGAIQTQVSALVADPRGGVLQYAWSLCPVESTMACDDFETLLANEDPNATQMLRDMRALGAQGTAAAVADPNSGALAYAIPPFDPVSASTSLYGSDRTSELVAYFYNKNAFNEGTGSWPVAVLSLTAPEGDQLVAVKRLVLGVHDPQAYAARLQATLGITLCPPGQTSAADPNCVALQTRQANQNPLASGMQWSASGSVTGPFTPVDNSNGPIPLQVNQVIRLHPSFPAEAYETYQTVVASLQSRRIIVQNLTEKLSVSWFATAGKLRDALTWPEFTISLDNTFTAPAVPTDSLTLWMVARDQRGGESWSSLVFRVTN